MEARLFKDLFSRWIKKAEMWKCAECRAYPVQDVFEMYSKDYRGGVPCGRRFAFVAGCCRARCTLQQTGSGDETDKASKGHQSIANGQA